MQKAQKITHHPSLNHKCGQAMIEFCIALVVIVLIISSLIDFSQIASKRSILSSTIRSDAGKKALHSTATSDIPNYITSWEESKDEMRHTADDRANKGSLATITDDLVIHSYQNPSDTAYTKNTHTAHQELSAGTPAHALGLILTSNSEELELSSQFSDKSHITIGFDLWLPKLSLD